MRRLRALGAVAGLALAAAGTAVVAAPSASAASASAMRPDYSYCFTSQGTNYGTVSCQTTSAGDSWQLVIVCYSTANSAITQKVTGLSHSGNGSDTLYCPSGYLISYASVNNNN
ncbi:hypothetical protein [Actinacidiphila yeochonensis]|uniref:hypothetical protein n=1 Tax=Actinacidiphila yeochonensis TaxID=89050 RepID=UPI000567D543|nr:hypothetical protein [Actinacidiphila yeochonensis]